VRALLVAVLAVGCATQAETSTVDQNATVCGAGPTVKGIDVSFYQGTIDWSKAKADGVVYAMIRVSDGLANPDSKFAANWAASRTAGVIHGAYQFFEPGDDPIAQADMLLSKMGSFKADDLPPTIDVEVTGGLSPATVAAKVKQWVAHVKAKVGRDPIVYTGMYFWRDSVGGANVLPAPLFHAQYTSAACPDIAAPWTDWAFWQYTSSGAINGISGSVDVDRWNGTKPQLLAFLGPPGTCGDGTCDPSESKISCPEDCGPCGTIDATGGMRDDSDACFVEGGPVDFMRHVSTAGNDGNLIWTHATAEATEANFGEWNLFFAAAGHYKVEVYTSAAFAQSKRAKYVVHTATADVGKTIDQTAVDGWQELGDFDFAAGGHQWLHLGDNTGEAAADNIQLVFDGVRVTPLDGGDHGGSDGGSGSDAVGGQHGGCNAGGGNGFGLVVLGVLGALLRRRNT
jgi:lysozyme